MPTEILENIQNQTVQFDDVYYTKLNIDESSRGLKPGVLSTVEGPFMEVEIENRNGRKYTQSLIRNKIVEADYTKEQLENRTLLGEARHPQDRYEVWIPDVSHNIIALWFNEDGTLLMGRADILDTPMGRIVQTLVDYGSKVGISARASGRMVQMNGDTYAEEESYQFKTFDFVTNPSFVQSRMEELPDSLTAESIYEPMKQIIENEESSLPLLEACKSILNSVSSNKLKELVPLIEARLDVEDTTDIVNSDEDSEVDDSEDDETTVLGERIKQLELENAEFVTEKDAFESDLEKHKKEIQFLKETLSMYAEDDDISEAYLETQNLNGQLSKVRHQVGINKRLLTEARKAQKKAEMKYSLLENRHRKVLQSMKGYRDSARANEDHIQFLQEEMEKNKAVVPVAQKTVKRNSNRKPRASKKVEAPILESVVDTPTRVSAKVGVNESVSEEYTRLDRLFGQSSFK